MRTFARTRSGLTAAVLTAVVLAACGQGGAASTSTPAAVTLPPATAAAASQAPAAVPTDAELVIAVEPGPLGPHLTAGGRTVYRFTNDSAGTSTCAGACATTWPALVPTGGAVPTAAPEVTGTIGTVIRADGKVQLSINGFPLYLYSGDQAAGDANGQGIGGKWFMVGPDGSTMTGAGAGASASPKASKCAGYYCP